MSFLSEKGKERPESAQKVDRWGSVLEEVVAERRTGEPWWRRVLAFLAWAAGFAGAAAVVVVVLLLIVDLFSKGRLFGPRTLSDWMFWASALLMGLGLISPTQADLQDSRKKKREDRQKEDRSASMLRRRLRRTYDPWRWRLWGAALFAFGLSALFGVFA